MTLIIGARCKDGVVLVGDRKVSGSLQQYTNKIRRLGQADWIIFSAAGMEALFKEFLEEVEKEYLFTLSIRDAQRQANPDIPIPPFTLNDFKHICTETAKRLKSVYSELGENTPFQFRLQVLFVAYELVGMSRRKAILFYMDMGECFPYPQEEGRIIEIGQPDLGKVFLASYKTGEFTMKEIARLAAFVIKYVEEENLSYEQNTIGVGDGQPQIWFYPDSDTEARPYEVQGNDLETLLAGIDEEVERIRNQIGSVSRFLRS